MSTRCQNDRIINRPTVDDKAATVAAAAHLAISDATPLSAVFTEQSHANESRGSQVEFGRMFV